MKITNYILSGFTTLVISGGMYAQQNGQITLSELQALAKENYPLLKQKQMYTDIAGNKTKQLSTNFLPQASVVGQATYQSEVTQINIQISNWDSFGRWNLHKAKELT